MLLTKLHTPPTGKNYVHRPLLFDRLNEGLGRKLILVSAPAGFGKTSLISDWINQSKISKAWISLDKGDNDPVEFVSYLVSGIQGIHKEFGDAALRLLKSPNKPTPESIASLLINDLIEIEKDILLVLDDFHLIQNSEIMIFLSYFLEHIPENTHVVISTRSDPLLPLARYRSHKQLQEVRSSDLCFQTREVSTFLNKRLRLDLSQDDIVLLQEKTEGWIAGLQLAALSIQDSEDPSKFVSEFAGDHRYIMDYLIEEVLNNQTKDIREFLLLTSCLDQFSGPLCNAILKKDDSQDTIEDLEKNNMFIVPLDSEKNWYRYHHLFADLLQRRLNISHISDTQALYLEASLWYEREGIFSKAIEYAVLAKDFSRSMQLLDHSILQFWEEGQHDFILKYGELIPDEMISNHPNFSLYYSWILISAGKFKDANRYLTQAEKLLIDSADTHESSKLDAELPGKISVAFAFLFSSSGQVEHLFKYCKKAVSQVSDQDPMWYSWAWYSCGLGHMMTDDLSESAKAFRLALTASEKTDNLYLISTISNRFAFCELQRGNYYSAYRICQNLNQFVNEGDYSQLAENEWSFAGLYTTMGHIEHQWAEGDALRNAELGYVLSGKGNDVTSQVFSTIVYIRILRHYGELKKVENLIKELDILVKEREIFPYLRYTCFAVKLGVYIRFNQKEKAAHFIESLQLNANDEVNNNNELLYSSFARMLLAESKVDEAETLLNKLHSLAEKEGRRERLVELKVLQAVNQQILENQEMALAHLSESLALAEEENLIISFVNEGEQIARLLETLYRQYSAGKFGYSKKFLGRVIRTVEKREKRQSTSSLYSISKREIDVLRLMAENLSNQEIADQLFVSVNTVKAHAKSIHLKLEVDSRIKAVTKAKELALL